MERNEHPLVHFLSLLHRRRTMFCIFEVPQIFCENLGADVELLGLLSMDIQDVSQQHGLLATHRYNVRPPNDSKVGL